VIELFRPSVPPIEKYLPYIKKVDENQMYSNFGPMQSEFKERLAKQYEMKAEQLEFFSSGTTALIAALHVLRSPQRPYCILPSWTFVATVHAAVAAGLEPVFVDVDAQSMQVTQAELSALPPQILERASVAVLVAPFGATLNLDGIDQLSKKFGFSVLCDCAASFESVRAPLFPTIISLHATKMFGIGEGGLLMSSDEMLIQKTHTYINFGFESGRQAKYSGINGKLSEFHAAVGMGGLDAWPESRDLYYSRARIYLDASKKMDIKLQTGWGKQWLSSTCVIQFPSPEVKQHAVSQLNHASIQCRDWWNQGCHKERAFTDVLAPMGLKNTDYLAQTTLGIPFYRDITVNQAEEVFQRLQH
jgi:dTDP-4-amino-4,6-dideoxygalactose transaminase